MYVCDLQKSLDDYDIERQTIADCRRKFTSSTPDGANCSLCFRHLIIYQRLLIPNIFGGFTPEYTHARAAS